MARILIADDEPAVRKLCRRILEEAGHIVREAADGKTAVRVLGEEPTDVLLCDLLMPEMDGLEVIRALAGQGSAPKIIAMTGGGSYPEAGGDLLKIAGYLGAVRVLEKPFPSQALLDAVEQVLGGAGPT
jgi:CheY-like chemotaxis protein